ncbi:MAG: hypothetical protein ACOH2J_20460 [Allorhizobium sp.]
MSDDHDRKIDKLLEGTHFIATVKGSRVVINQVESGKSVYVTDGTHAQIIEFLEIWPSMNGKLQKALANGSIFIDCGAA